MAMVIELSPRANESIIHERGCMSITNISQWDWNFMSSRVIRRDVKQIPMEINVLGGLFHHLLRIWASNLIPPDLIYEL